LPYEKSDPLGQALVRLFRIKCAQPACNTPGMAEEMRRMSREGTAARLVEPEEMVPPLLYVVSRAADRVNGWRFDANLWEASLPPPEAARRAGRPAGFAMHPSPLPRSAL
jgi:hypothetical protein